MKNSGGVRDGVPALHHFLIYEAAILVDLDYLLSVSHLHSEETLIRAYKAKISQKTLAVYGPNHPGVEKC